MVQGWIVKVLVVFSDGNIENRSRYHRNQSARRNEGGTEMHV